MKKFIQTIFVLTILTGGVLFVGEGSEAYAQCATGYQCVDGSTTDPSCSGLCDYGASGMGDGLCCPVSGGGSGGSNECAADGADYVCTPDDQTSGKSCTATACDGGFGVCCKPASGGGGGGAGGGSKELKNPLQFDTIEGFLTAVIGIILLFAYPIIVLFIMYAGFMYVTANGDTGKLEKARSALLWAVIGGVIVLGAKVIMEVVKGTVDSFK